MKKEFSRNDPPETLFEKIKSWEISFQVSFAVSFDESKTKELFDKILEAVTIEKVKQSIVILLEIVEETDEISGGTATEIEYYQGLFSKDYNKVSHIEVYQTFIEDKINKLYLICNELLRDEQNLYEIKDYINGEEQYFGQFSEIRRGFEVISANFTETKRYIPFYKKLLIHLAKLKSQ